MEQSSGRGRTGFLRATVGLIAAGMGFRKPRASEVVMVNKARASCHDKSGNGYNRRNHAGGPGAWVGISVLDPAPLPQGEGLAEGEGVVICDKCGYGGR